MSEEPAGRRPAPEPLRLVQAFINTLDLEAGVERLTSVAALRRWIVDEGLGGRHVEVDEPELRRAIELREALRDQLVAEHEGRPEGAASAVIDRAARAARVGLRFDGATLRLAPAAGGVDGALGRILVVAAQAMADGSWSRLKACRMARCRWVFYDASKNRSGTWCSMAICGNRQKGKRYRSRRPASAPA
jgi:predicted RNA-binding Zn ribbon-like protein